MPSTSEAPKRMTILTTYFSLVREYGTMLLSPQRIAILRMYASITGDAWHRHYSLAEARTMYRQWVATQQGIIPDDHTLEQIEKRGVLHTRLVGAWMIVWIVLFPALYPTYCAIKYLKTPGHSTLLIDLLTVAWVLFFTSVLIILGLYIQGALSKYFFHLCARCLTIPGVVDFWPVGQVPEGAVRNTSSEAH